MRSQRRVARAACVLAGIIVAQILLYGPSLTGQLVLLPLGILRAHLPMSVAGVAQPNIDRTFADVVLVDEIMRVRAARELRAGRIPLWDPDNFAGAPFVANNVSAVFSPYRLLEYLFPAPTTLAWTQLLKALVAGSGAFLFFRRTMRVGFWPAAVGAWCFPLTGYLVLWTGMGSSSVVSWLPWILLATDGVVRHPRGWSGPGLLVVTGLVLLSGHAADGALVLLASGIHAVYRLLARFGWRQVLRLRCLGTAAELTAAWLLGMLLSAPVTLPTLEYLGFSDRMAHRANHLVERPATGSAALAQIGVPYIFGSTKSGQYLLLSVYLQESAAAGYAGLTTMLVLAPLAFQRRRRRREATFWLVAAILGAAATLGIPGVETLTRLPGVRILTFNRFMFFTAFAVLALGVLGIETMGRRYVWRRWNWWPMLVALAFAGWCFYRLAEPPSQIRVVPGTESLGLFPVPPWFMWIHLVAASLSLLAAFAWLALREIPNAARVLRYGLPLLLLGEMFWNSFGVFPQGDARMYYPPLDIFAKLPDRREFRVSGMSCFPPMLNQMYGLRDIRGYDGVDPRWIVELLLANEAQVPDWTRPYIAHAMTMHHVAPFRSPVHDLLGVRYLVFHGKPLWGMEPTFTDDDPNGYSIVERPHALPRCFVPRRAVAVSDPSEVFDKMQRPEFDPADVAYVLGGVEVSDQEARGTAKITREESNEVELAIEMQSPGLVVLTDMWYPGWHAYIGGQERPILRTDYALRGVEVEAGRSELIFRYEPASFAWGVRLAAIAGTILIVWSLACAYRQRGAHRRTLLAPESQAVDEPR